MYVHGHSTPFIYSSYSMYGSIYLYIWRARLKKHTIVSLQLSPQTSLRELFSLHLPRDPTTNAGGGARLRDEYRTCRIDPHGVIQFAEGSREKQVVEEEGTGVEVRETL